MAAPADTGNMQLDPKHDDYDFPVVAPVPQDGHPGHLTPEQNEKVQQLRASLEQKGYTERLDTLTLVCWLQQRPPSSLPKTGLHEANISSHVLAAIPARAQVRPGSFRGHVRFPVPEIHSKSQSAKYLQTGKNILERMLTVYS